MKLSAPTPQIQWYKDGKQIVTGESVIVSFILMKNGILENLRAPQE